MSRFFSGSVNKTKSGEESSYFGVLSDFQDGDDQVKGEPPLDQSAVDEDAESVVLYDPNGEETEPVEPTTEEDEVSAAGSGENVRMFNTNVKQFNPRYEFNAPGTVKKVKKESKKMNYIEMYYWRMIPKNGRPDIHTITTTVNGKKVTYSYAYFDWVFDGYHDNINRAR